MKIAFSPCPNDTFVFHAWVHGLIPGAPVLDVMHVDIDITNHLATSNSDFDVLKISYAVLPWVLSEYALLPCGGALGYSCGPLVLTKEAVSLPIDPFILKGQRIAIPSEHSTAYLLFRLWAAQNVPGGIGNNIIVMPFHSIMPALRDGSIDAGLVIHEARFTYPAYGLKMLVDLGNWWKADTGLPVPLGAIIAHRMQNTSAITHWIRASVAYAQAHPEASRTYILARAQEMLPEVAAAHIKLYINKFTVHLGEEGYAAVKTLLGRAANEGLVPLINFAALYK